MKGGPISNGQPEQETNAERKLRLECDKLVKENAAQTRALCKRLLLQGKEKWGRRILGSCRVDTTLHEALRQIA